MRVVRYVGIGASLTLLALIVLALSLLGNEIDTVVILCAILPAAAAYLFFTACLEWDGGRQRVRRGLAYLGMLPSAYGLVSFSFVVWPLLLMMAPAALMGSRAQPSTSQSAPRA